MMYVDLKLCWKDTPRKGKHILVPAEGKETDEVEFLVMGYHGIQMLERLDMYFLLQKT